MPVATFQEIQEDVDAIPVQAATAFFTARGSEGVILDKINSVITQLSLLTVSLQALEARVTALETP